MLSLVHSLGGVSYPEFVIVIVNLGFLQCPQKRSRGNQLIHRRPYKAKSRASRSTPESRESCRQTVRRLWWMMFTSSTITIYDVNIYIYTYIHTVYIHTVGLYIHTVYMRNGNKQKNNFIPNVQSAGKEGKIYCAPISTRGENEFIVQGSAVDEGLAKYEIHR